MSDSGRGSSLSGEASSTDRLLVSCEVISVCRGVMTVGSACVSLFSRVFKVENLTPTANPESNLTPSFLAPTGALGDRILDVLESLGGRA